MKNMVVLIILVTSKVAFAGSKKTVVMSESVSKDACVVAIMNAKYFEHSEELKKIAQLVNNKSLRKNQAQDLYISKAFEVMKAAQEAGQKPTAKQAADLLLSLKSCENVNAYVPLQAELYAKSSKKFHVGIASKSLKTSLLPYAPRRGLAASL